MKKEMILVILMALCSLAMNAEPLSNSSEKMTSKGYRGNVSAAISFDCIFKNDIAGFISTSHGYYFGKGLWLGGGMGVFLPIDEVPSLPFYSEIKYTCLNEKVSPYIACKLGFCLYESAEDLYAYISPTIGLNIGNWSFFMSYNDIRLMKFTNVGFAWNFR